MERQFATFFLDDKMFGIDILLIKEINRHLEITPVSGAPDFISGLMNMRGQIVTVLDLGLRLGLGKRRIESQSRCIVLKTTAELKYVQDKIALGNGTRAESVGLLVDRIGDMVLTADSAINPPPANLGGLEGRYLAGVARMGEDLLVTLNVMEILSLERKG